MTAIATSGTNGGSVTTAKESGESTSTWIERHNRDVQAAESSGGELATTWQSSTGTQSVRTEREVGESDEEFTLRHIVEYLAEMEKEPPIP
ncbi:MAG: hypothetical protein SGI72_17925 [Planctomycetota bacterium]|nr:hypothetical protein [Planctomycetota bacterium]